MRSVARLVLFGSGSPLALAAFEALRGRGLTAVVVPGSARTRDVRGWLRSHARRRAAAELAARATRAGCALLEWRPGGSTRLAEALRTLAPELICVASFPRLLPTELLDSASASAIGLHPSLLPRHRGPDPLFWTYVSNDREVGISLHHLDAGEDTGDLIGQQRLPLTRGRPVAELYSELAARGAVLLSGVLGALLRGEAPRVPQDPGAATREGRPGDWRLDPAAWPCERVWHVLSGLGPRRALLADASGRFIPHGRTLGFRLEAHGREPGSLETTPGRLRVYCRDGVVEAEAAHWLRRLLPRRPARFR